MSIAGQEPAAVGLLTVDRDPITGELRRVPAGARGYRQRVPSPCVRDFADDYEPAYRTFHLIRGLATLRVCW